MNPAIYPNLVSPTGANTYLPEIPYSNPLAPPWMFPQWGNPWCEQEYTYTFPVVVPAAATGPSGQLRLDFDVDSEFHVVDTYIRYIDQDVINDSVLVRLTDATNKRRNSDYITVRDYNGFIPRDWIIPPGGKQRLELVSLTAADPRTVWVMFRGFKRFQYQRCAPIPAGFKPVQYVPLWARYSAPPPGFVDESYTYEFEVYNVTGPAPAQPQNATFGLDTDAPFLLRTITVESVTIDGGAVLVLRLIDPWGNVNVLQANPASRNVPYSYIDNFAGSPFSSTFGRSVYPELICPAGSVLGVQALVTVGATTAQGIVRCQGVKRFRQGE